MTLIKARPKLRVRVPAEILPGTEFVATAIVECRRAVAVESMRMSLEGQERFEDPRKNGKRGKLELVRMGMELCGKRVFEPGHHEIPVQIPLPPGLPPSYRGSFVQVEYRLSVHADIEWWPDAYASFPINVAPLPIASPDGKPVIHASGNAQRRERPYAELSLACDWTRAGELVRGAIALFNTQSNRYFDGKISLTAMESGFGVTMRATSYVCRIGIERRGEGEMIPFEFRLPATAAPSFPGRFTTLTYALVLTAHRQWGGELEIAVPFRVLPHSKSSRDAPPPIAPPAVGSDRLQKLWESVGAQHGMSYAWQRLIGQRGDVALVVSRQHRGRDGTYLSATFSFPDLHIGLSIEPSTGLDAFIPDVTIGDDTFDDHHRVHAADAGQAQAFLRPLLPHLYLSNAHITTGSDTALSLEIRDAGTSSKTLGPFIAGAAALGDAIEKARHMIPPPRGLRPALSSWIELARRLGGTLERARMRITGDIEGTAVHANIELEKGEPRAMWLAVAPASPLDEDHSFSWTEGGPAPSFRGELGELVRAACDGATDLRIEPTRIVVALASILGFDPALTPELVQRRIERLLRIAMVLRAQQGPYR